MSQNSKDFFRGSFAAWLCTVLLAMVAWNANKLYDKVDRLSETLVSDRERMNEIVAGERLRINEISFKLDALYRAVGELKKDQP